MPDIRDLIAMAPLMNREVEPLPFDEQQPLMNALVDAQQALYRAEDQYMLGNSEGLILGMQTALKRLQEVLQ